MWVHKAGVMGVVGSRTPFSCAGVCTVPCAKATEPYCMALVALVPTRAVFAASSTPCSSRVHPPSRTLSTQRKLSWRLLLRSCFHTPLPENRRAFDTGCSLVLVPMALGLAPPGVPGATSLFPNPCLAEGAGRRRCRFSG